MQMLRQAREHLLVRAPRVRRPGTNTTAALGGAAPLDIGQP